MIKTACQRQTSALVFLRNVFDGIAAAWLKFSSCVWVIFARNHWCKYTQLHAEGELGWNSKVLSWSLNHPSDDVIDSPAASPLTSLPSDLAANHTPSTWLPASVAHTLTRLPLGLWWLRDDGGSGRQRSGSLPAAVHWLWSQTGLLWSLKNAFPFAGLNPQDLLSPI